MKILKHAIHDFLFNLPHGFEPWKFFSLDHTEEVSDGEVVGLEVEQQLVPVHRGHLQHAATVVATKLLEQLKFYL